MEQLPVEIKKYIFLYIDNNTLIWINKDYYKKYHKNLINSSNIRKNKNEYSFIRHIIKKDYAFVFEENLLENFNKWILKKKIYHGYLIYANYIYFLLNYCIEEKSPKCKNILVETMKSKGLYNNIKNKQIYKIIRYK
jgi:hypothetical protein